MLPKIPSNTYPIRPSTTATYWQAVQRNKQLVLNPNGSVPMWVGFHDGTGENRKLTVLLTLHR